MLQKYNYVGCVNNYYLGFFLNFRYVNATKISILITTTETQPVQYSVEIPGVGYYRSGILSASNLVVLNISSTTEVTSPNDQDKGIYVTTSSHKVTVVGQNSYSDTSDSFHALPITELNNTTYEYYGISVARTVVHNHPHYSAVLIVGTENNTIMNLTVTQSVNIRVGNITTNLIPGRQYSFVINRLQTIYIRSLEDLTGTKIITDKQISLFSGHQCGHVPYNIGNCDYMIEQIPPTALWGKVFYTAPLATRKSYTIKILAA